VSPSDLDVALRAAVAGAEVVRSRWGQPFDVFGKEGKDFATDVDIAAERAILAVLTMERPADVVVGEELGSTGDESAGRRWFVDPLCGTANFAAGTGPVGVNVALEADTGSICAAVADPQTGEVFWTDGTSAGVRRAGSDQPLAPSAHTGLVDVIIDLYDRPDRPFRPHALIADADFLDQYSPRAVATSLALTWVAAGRRAAYLGSLDMRASVHFAAGLAICRGAGATVTDLHGGPTDSGRGLLAAADADTHADLLRRIGDQLAG
jgi:myo-inositol-1(or 4)-monophosphatase